MSSSRCGYITVILAIIGFGLYSVYLLPPFLEMLQELRDRFLQGDVKTILFSFGSLFIALAVCSWFAYVVALEEERKQRIADTPVDTRPIVRLLDLPSPRVAGGCQGHCVSDRLVCHRCWHPDSDMGPYYQSDVIPEIRRS